LYFPFGGGWKGNIICAGEMKFGATAKQALFLYSRNKMFQFAAAPLVKYGRRRRRRCWRRRFMAPDSGAATL